MTSPSMSTVHRGLRDLARRGTNRNSRNYMACCIHIVHAQKLCRLSSRRQLSRRSDRLLLAARSFTDTRRHWLVSLIPQRTRPCTRTGDEVGSRAGVGPGGNVDRARMAIRQYGCQTGHAIPGATAPDALVGPPLNGIGSRAHVGGVLSNSPDHMIAWLKNPKAFEPLSAVPALGLTDEAARDIAACLFTLR